ncbi:MAG: permease [Alphaproteobacteria bacterium]|nr:permease [Alphaproteobacteria bacterium]
MRNIEETPKIASKTVPSCCASENSDSGQSHKRKKIDKLLWGSAAVVIPLFMLAWLQPSIMPTWLSAMADSVYHTIHAIWWGVLIGMAFIGLLNKIPQTFIVSILGKGGTFNGLLRATGAGVLLDLCSHGILMVAAKLYQRGASGGQVIAFLLASPWNSFSLTLVLIGLIGFKLTLLFIALSMVIALITGFMFDRLIGRGILPANHHAFDLPDNFHFWAEAKKGMKNVSYNRQFFSDVIKSGVKDSRMVMRWLLFGILLAALLRGFVDAGQFATFFGPTLLGLLITTLLATVLEVCSEGSAPIAADIVNRAGAAGNGFAFLMAGVATDYTEMMVLKETTKSWRFAMFLPLITVPQIIIVSLLINIYL